MEVVSLPAEDSGVIPTLTQTEKSSAERRVGQRVSGTRRVVKVTSENSEPTFHITLAQLSEAIASALRSVKIYVVESEITEAQRAVRAVVEESHF